MHYIRLLRYRNSLIFWRYIMKLSFDKIKEITLGVIDFKEENGYLYPRRCTDTQVQTWYTMGDIHGKRSKMSAGVRLDFHTNSSTMRLEYPENTSYSLLIDGVFLRKIENDENCSVAIALPEGEKRVTIVFHYDKYGAIKSLELDDGASCVPHKSSKKFLFLGDSITQGYYTEFEFINYPFLVSEFFDADYLNQAIGGGDFYAPTVDMQLGYEPDAVFIAFGTNDWSHFPTLEILKMRCSDYLDAIKKKYSGKKIFGLTPLWRADENTGRAMGSFEQCCSLIKNELTAHGITVIDGYNLMPHNPKFFFDEYLHPNELGFTLYAQNLIKEIRKYI